jgi:hypothetical protein
MMTKGELRWWSRWMPPYISARRLLSFSSTAASVLAVISGIAQAFRQASSPVSLASSVLLGLRAKVSALVCGSG